MSETTIELPPVIPKDRGWGEALICALPASPVNHVVSPRLFPSPWTTGTGTFR